MGDSAENPEEMVQTLSVAGQGSVLGIMIVGVRATNSRPWLTTEKRMRLVFRICSNAKARCPSNHQDHGPPVSVDVQR